MNVIGVSMSRHDRAAALWQNGQPSYAIAEERLDRRKRSFSNFSDGKVNLPPMAAVNYVLESSGLRHQDIDLVVCGRSVSSCAPEAVRYLPFPSRKICEVALPSHHLAHAYSAFATARFENAAVLVIDEQGHHVGRGFEALSWFSGEGVNLRSVRNFFGSEGRLSLGMMYDIFAGMVGLTEAGLPAPGKLMALSAFGGVGEDFGPEWLCLEKSGNVYVDVPLLAEFFDRVEIPTHSLAKDLKCRTFVDLSAKFAPIHWDSDEAKFLAAVAQSALELGLMHTATALQRTTGQENLAYAGGVALNCVANSKLAGAGFKDVFVHPAATDDGVAMGLAAYGSLMLGESRRSRSVFLPFLGKNYVAKEAEDVFDAYDLSPYVTRGATVETVARELSAGRIVCWFAGRSEWGPRALGSRSILANPTVRNVVDIINCRVKHREPFRPFGVSVPVEKAGELLDLEGVPEGLGPYMLAVARPKDERLSGVTHRDGTIRYQLVPRCFGIYHKLLTEFEGQTGLACLVNTSFNTWGEPLVESPEDAVRQFLLSGADLLYLDSCWLDLNEVDEVILDAARASATCRSSVKPLARARALEAAGYPDQALKIALEIPSDLTHGVEHEVSRSAVVMRLTLRSDPERCLREAINILQFASLGRSASEASRVIKELGVSQGAIRLSEAGRLLDVLSSTGGALKAVESALGAPLLSEQDMT